MAGEDTRSGFYAGVHYLVKDGEEWYRREDVERVLGVEVTDVDERLYHVEDGEGVKEYISNLATVVDGIIEWHTETMRQLWVGAWYDDLTFCVETGKPLPSMVAGDYTGDTISDLIEVNVKVAREIAESLVDGVRDALGTMSLALDNLQDCVTYLDGFRTGALMGSGDAPGIQNLFADLCGVEDSMTRVHSMIEDVVNGGGHEQ